ncbi:MAG: hypothetical protein NC217_08340 [Muribaculaceae bacterium]|nr:hypothetical protein [Muribaculaceae bacterium]
MNKLKELYANREVFETYNAKIPEELLKEIYKEEQLLLDQIKDRIIDDIPEQIEEFTDLPFVLGLEYVDGKLERLGISPKPLNELFEVNRALDTDEEGSVEEINTGYSSKGVGFTRNESIGFSVKFADGTLIKYNTAQRTLIETLKHIGLDRVAKYKDESFKGFPLVGKRKRVTRPSRTWQKLVDGWWIYVVMGNPRAIACIKGVAKMLGISLEIIMNDGSEVPCKYPHTQNRKP